MLTAGNVSFTKTYISMSIAVEVLIYDGLSNCDEKSNQNQNEKIIKAKDNITNTSACEA